MAQTQYQISLLGLANNLMSAPVVNEDMDTPVSPDTRLFVILKAVTKALSLADVDRGPAGGMFYFAKI